MSILETLLVFGGPTIGIILLVVLAVLGPHRAQMKRYRVGEEWGYAPLWWTADPEGAHLPEPAAPSAGGERGGARGNW